MSTARPTVTAQLMIAPAIYDRPCRKGSAWTDRFPTLHNHGDSITYPANSSTNCRRRLEPPTATLE